MSHIIKTMIVVSYTMILIACGGGGGGSTSDTPTNNDTINVADTSTETETETETQAEEPLENEGGFVSVGSIDALNLSFADVTVTGVTLPNGNTNAREVYQLAHYIARTEPEEDEENIDIPIRSYSATCATDTTTPRMFTSVTLQDSEDSDLTYGSVYELQYNASTGGFVATDNTTILHQCYESHGIAVSKDCSRVAVLCNTEYGADKNYNITKDLVESSGIEFMQMEDNHAAIDRRIAGDDADLGLMLVTNSSSYMGFFTNHDSINIEDYSAQIAEALPSSTLDYTSFSKFKSKWYENAMNIVLADLSSNDLEALKQYVRDNGYRENNSIWLLEWDAGITVDNTPTAYIVNKMHGGTDLGAEELLYVEDDSLGRASYGFSVSARVFDEQGDSHYSAGLTIVERNNWSIVPAYTDARSDDERGWYWACGNGHDLNIRSFYSPYTEKYGAICTSDAADKVSNAHGDLGTIGIKMDSSSSVTDGYSIHAVQSNSSMLSNGGGHTVVPVNNEISLALAVAPKLIADDEMERFLTEQVGIDAPIDGVSYDEQCAPWFDENNCFFSYAAYNYWWDDEDDDDFSMIPRQSLSSGDALEPQTLTRIGIAQVNAESGSIQKKGFNWLVEDADCQLSDPQLVDLKNGRYLLGYAKFQCISEGLSYNRSDSTNGSKRMLIPAAYYVMEIDVDGNVLSGPEELINHGWGGLDEPVYLGNGKVAWTYIKNPTLTGYIGGQQSEWEAIIYHSKSTE